MGSSIAVFTILLVREVAHAHVQAEDYLFWGSIHFSHKILERQSSLSLGGPKTTACIWKGTFRFHFIVCVFNRNIKASLLNGRGGQGMYKPDTLEIKDHSRQHNCTQDIVLYTMQATF